MIDANNYSTIIGAIECERTIRVAVDHRKMDTTYAMIHNAHTHKHTVHKTYASVHRGIHDTHTRSIHIHTNMAV
jgi:hypothetical protein